MTTEEICLRSMSNDELGALKNKLTLELNWIDSEVVRREGEKIFAVVDQYSPIGEVSFEFDASAVPPVLCEICGDPATCGERCDACCAGCIDNNHTKDGVGGEA